MQLASSWKAVPGTLCVWLLLAPPLLAQEEAAAPGATPAGENAAAGTPNRPAPAPLLQNRPADVKHDAYDWDRPEPWSEKPRDRSTPPPTQEEQRRPNLETMRDSQGRILIRYARELAADGRVVQALDRYRNFLVLYPRHEWRLEALLGAAEILLDRDRVEEAVGYLEQAYRDAPHQERGALAYLRAGKLRAEMGEFDRARKIFTQLVERKPTSRVERLASIELNSLGFLDSETTGGKTGGSEIVPAVPLISDDEPAAGSAQSPTGTGTNGAPGAGSGAGAEKRPVPGTKPAETETRDALERMGEGVEEL